MRYEGVPSLWRGLSPALAMSIPATIVYFVGYDAVRDTTRQHIGEDSFLYQYSPLWAGGVARSKFDFLNPFYCCERVESI